MYPESVTDLIENFKKLPGIGQRTAERLAFSVVKDFLPEDFDFFIDSLVSVRDNIKYCKVCHCISDSDVCNICSDKSRNKDLIVVVQHYKDVFLLEKMGNFNGYYHVLGGLISPFDDVGPSDINIFSLVDRVKKDNVKELVFFTKFCIEADTTVLYVKKLLKDSSVIVSKVANGIPIGADMDYLDSLTLESALANRKEVLD